MSLRAARSCQTFSSALRWLFSFATWASESGSANDKGSSGSQTDSFITSLTLCLEQNPNKYQKYIEFLLQFWK